MSLDFSEPFRANGPVAFSPDGRYIAAAVDNRLVVRDSDSLEVVRLDSCLDKIQRLEWTRDSALVLCASYKKAAVHCFSISDPDWVCKIDEGAAGLAFAWWAPCGQQVLCVAEFNIRLTAWSLTDRGCFQMRGPKFAHKGLSASPSGQFLAVAERRDCRDHVTVFQVKGWKVAAHFEVLTSDLEDLAYSPDGAAICCWDGPLEAQVLVYAPDGQLLARHAPAAAGLGVKTVQWSPDGQLLSVGSFDQSVRVLNNRTWQPLAEFRHGDNPGPSAFVYREEEDVAARRAHYAIAQPPFAIPAVKPLPDRPAARCGVGLAAWSADSRFLATRDDSTPTAVFIWELPRLALAAVLVHLEPVRALAWDPLGPRLGVCTGGPRVYLWTPDGASCVHVPLPGFAAETFAWSGGGGGFLLTDGKEQFCCAWAGSGEEGA